MEREALKAMAASDNEGNRHLQSKPVGCLSPEQEVHPQCFQQHPSALMNNRTNSKGKSDSYLTGPEDDPVVKLLTMIFVFVQLLPPQTHCNRAQVLIHTQVVPVFYWK